MAETWYLGHGCVSPGKTSAQEKNDQGQAGTQRVKVLTAVHLPEAGNSRVSITQVDRHGSSSRSLGSSLRDGKRAFHHNLARSRDLQHSGGHIELKLQVLDPHHQVVCLALDDLERRTREGANVARLADPVRCEGEESVRVYLTTWSVLTDGHRGGHDRSRGNSEAERPRRVLSNRLPLLVDLPDVLRLNHESHQVRLVVDHGASDAGGTRRQWRIARNNSWSRNARPVGPLSVGRADDVHSVGLDVLSAVLGMDERRRERREVDVVPEDLCAGQLPSPARKVPRQTLFSLQGPVDVTVGSMGESVDAEVILSRISLSDAVGGSARWRARRP